MRKIAIYMLALNLLVWSACTDGSKDALRISVEKFPASFRHTVDTLLGSSGTDAGFILIDLSNKKKLIYNKDRVDSGFLPASTFKIFNSLVFLQEGIISDTTVIRWDSVDRDWDKWNQDMTLSHALRYSAVWAYKKLAPQVGKARIQYWLTKADYGNATIGGNVDDFWLAGNLKITPRQQVEFLQRLYRNDLPFDPTIQVKVKEMMEMESTDHYSWHYKTGWADKPNPDIAWNVGFVETAEGTYFYALNLDATNTKTANLRKTLPRKLLNALDILPNYQLQ